MSELRAATHRVFQVYCVNAASEQRFTCLTADRLSSVVVNALAFGPRSPGFESPPCHYSTGCNLGQVVYSHCLHSLLSSKKLEYYKREYSDWTDLTA